MRILLLLLLHRIWSIYHSTRELPSETSCAVCSVCSHSPVAYFHNLLWVFVFCFSSSTPVDSGQPASLLFDCAQQPTAATMAWVSETRWTAQFRDSAMLGAYYLHCAQAPNARWVLVISALRLDLALEDFCRVDC